MPAKRYADRRTHPSKGRSFRTTKGGNPAILPKGGRLCKKQPTKVFPLFEISHDSQIVGAINRLKGEIRKRFKLRSEETLAMEGQLTFWVSPNEKIFLCSFPNTYVEITDPVYLRRIKELFMPSQIGTILRSKFSAEEWASIEGFTKKWSGKTRRK